ncbi:phospholipase [Halobacillus rhizosphaerae]|uniref:phospholipase n=1 Tax=Halobacillus rhizosphaerae TaxID=3064889 RepID=UPI00398A52D8
MSNSRNRRGYFPRFCIFPGYKWCGPGCSGPGAPINAVDAACKAHDECYQQYGPCCYCDQQFLRQLSKLRNPHTLEGRHAQTIYQYMKLQSFFTCGI